MTFKEGDHILVSKYKNSFYNKIVPPIIRFVCDTKYHHCGVIAKSLDSENDELFVYEAIASGFEKTPLDDFMKKVNQDYDVEIWRPFYKNSFFNFRLKEIYKRPYDYSSLILYHVLLWLTGFWFGKKESDALKTIYCSEANAYLLGMQNYWMVHPGTLRLFLIKNSHLIYKNK